MDVDSYNLRIIALSIFIHYYQDFLTFSLITDDVERCHIFKFSDNLMYVKNRGGFYHNPVCRSFQGINIGCDIRQTVFEEIGPPVIGSSARRIYKQYVKPAVFIFFNPVDTVTLYDFELIHIENDRIVSEYACSRRIKFYSRNFIAIFMQSESINAKTGRHVDDPLSSACQRGVV